MAAKAQRSIQKNTQQVHQRAKERYEVQASYVYEIIIAITIYEWQIQQYQEKCKDLLSQNRGCQV